MSPLEDRDEAEEIDVGSLSYADLLAHFAAEDADTDRQLLAYPEIEEFLTDAMRIMHGINGTWLEQRVRETLAEARARVAGRPKEGSAVAGGWHPRQLVQGYRGLFVGIVIGVGGTLLTMPAADKAAPAPAPRIGAEPQDRPGMGPVPAFRAPEKKRDEPRW